MSLASRKTPNYIRSSLLRRSPNAQVKRAQDEGNTSQIMLCQIHASQIYPCCSAYLIADPNLLDPFTSALCFSPSLRTVATHYQLLEICLLFCVFVHDSTHEPLHVCMSATSTSCSLFDILQTVIHLKLFSMRGIQAPATDDLSIPYHLVAHYKIQISFASFPPLHTTASLSLFNCIQQS